jgi:hypothetical protein
MPTLRYTDSAGALHEPLLLSMSPLPASSTQVNTTSSMMNNASDDVGSHSSDVGSGSHSAIVLVRRNGCGTAPRESRGTLFVPDARVLRKGPGTSASDDDVGGFQRAMREPFERDEASAASVGRSRSGVRRRSEQTRFWSASGDDVGGSHSAIARAAPNLVGIVQRS